MIKAIIKLVIVVLVANAIWRVGSAYVSYYRFRDAVTEIAMNSKGKTDDQLREKIADAARQYDEPIVADDLAIRRDDDHTYVDGSYKKPVPVFPGYEYQWPFSLNVAGALIVPGRFSGLAHP